MGSLWNAARRAVGKKRPQEAGLQLCRAADGTMLLFPTAWIYVLPQPELLSTPYLHETVGKLVLDMADRWLDPPKPDGPPEKKPWMAAPGCRSHRAFCRKYQLIDIGVEKWPGRMEFSLTYIPRRDGRWMRENGDVELRARVTACDGERPDKTARRIGSAVGQIFRVAQVMDPLPDPDANAKEETKS